MLGDAAMSARSAHQQFSFVNPLIILSLFLHAGSFPVLAQQQIAPQEKTIGNPLTTVRPDLAYPASCQEVRALNSDAVDGNYTIFLNNSPQGPFSIYCHNMTAEPAEYLPLVFTAESQNFSRAATGGAYGGTDVITWFSRLRIDLGTMIVDPEDHTFATSTGHIVGAHDLTELPYAVAASCRARNDSSGTANVDLRSTHFSLDPSVVFALGGSFGSTYYPGGTTTFSSDRQVVDLTGGGYCGNNSLATPMKLKYSGSYFVTGRITTSTGEPIPDVRVSAGPNSNTTTDATGVYTVTNLLPGTYIITPTKDSYTFTPAFSSANVSVPPDAIAQDFIGTVNYDLDDGLVLHFSFDDGTATDRSGNQNNGTPRGNYQIVQGVTGQALKFGGYTSPGYIVVPNSSTLSFSDDFTFSLWFNIQGNTSMDGWGHVSEFGHQAFIGKSGDSNGLVLQASRSTVDGLWHILVINGRCCGSSGRTFLTDSG